MPLLYHAYVYLEFLILACTIYILAPQALKTPIKLAKGASLSRQNNSVNIAEGQSIRVNGGHVLTVTAHSKNGWC